MQPDRDLESQAPPPPPSPDFFSMINTSHTTGPSQSPAFSSASNIASVPPDATVVHATIVEHTPYCDSDDETVVDFRVEGGGDLPEATRVELVSVIDTFQLFEASDLKNPPKLLTKIIVYAIAGPPIVLFLFVKKGVPAIGTQPPPPPQPCRSS